MLLSPSITTFQKAKREHGVEEQWREAKTRLLAGKVFRTVFWDSKGGC